MEQRFAAKRSEVLLHDLRGDTVRINRGAKVTANLRNGDLDRRTIGGTCRNFRIDHIDQLTLRLAACFENQYGDKRAGKPACIEVCPALKPVTGIGMQQVAA